jgi:hypothetical protein
MRRHALARRLLVGAAAALALGALVTSFASCATTEEDPTSGDPGTPLPPAPDGAAPFDGGDAASDATCDAASSDCVSHVVTCAEAAWCPVPTPVSSLYALTSVWGTGKNDVWASGSGGTVVHYDGAAWAAAPTGLKNTFHVVIGTSPTDIWALSASDVMLHAKGFTPGGTVWTRVSAAPDEYSAVPLFAAWSSAPGQLRVGGRGFGFTAPNGNFETASQITGVIAADGGSTWTPVSGSGATVHGIWGSAPDDLWVVADNSANVGWQLGLTLHGTRAGDAGGLAWQSVDSQASVVLDAVWGSSASDVWTVGDLGTIRHLASDRSHWDPVESGTRAPLHAVWGSSASDVWAVGGVGTILHFDGKTWSPSTAAFPVGKTKPNLHGVWGSSASDVWIVGDGIVLHLTGAGGSK